ncbi:glycosyltransferase family 39 protein [Anaerolineales bacterium HSG24]|nr:glycosyltransferase family 39 protein [Anaerolineales bacterium HSG24]
MHQLTNLNYSRFFMTSHLSILLLTLLGFSLRLHYLTTTHPFFDEYTTVLASRQILQHGWPILPSGLFYEHGLLASYLIAPFTALFIHMPVEQWQMAHWGLMLSRWPSLLVSTMTIPLIFRFGRERLRHPLPALFAAGLFALSPEGMVWGGRARMYALATLLVLLIVYLAYRGLDHAPSRWLALLTLAALLLTQFGTLMLVPPLLVSLTIIILIRQPNRPKRAIVINLFWQLLSLGGIIVMAIWVKRLGQPVGKAALSDTPNSNIISELIATITYQITFYFTWPDTIKFLTRQFGPSHLYWLMSATVIGLGVSLILWLGNRYRLNRLQLNLAKLSISDFALFTLYLVIIVSLLIGQVVTLLEPFRRNPRYLVMYLPLFYLISGAIFHYLLLRFVRFVSRLFQQSLSSDRLRLQAMMYQILSLITFLCFIYLSWPDIRLALVTPEPAYEEAFAFIRANWQAGDALLTMNTPAAGLYMTQIDGFTVENEADQFLLNRETAPVDRWLGLPWVGTAPDFNQQLNSHQRVWFVSDTIRQPVYFRGSWQAIVTSQMEQVWASDNALVYLTRPDRQPLPSQPDRFVRTQLDGTIQLTGYSAESIDRQLQLTLFWQSLARVSDDYTVFVHLRDFNGDTLAQIDSQPIQGHYPTSHWQIGETIIDPISLPLPENLPTGDYQIFVGMYRLDTLARLPIADDLSGENAIMLVVE